jgi:hypothetical protein
LVSVAPAERLAGELEGCAHCADDAVGDDGRISGRRSGLPRLIGRRDLARRRRDVEEQAHHVHAGHAVDQRMMGLREQREAPALEPLDQPDLPEWLRPVEALGVHAPHQLAQVLDRPSAGQRGVAHVVVDVEARVVDPHRPAHLEARNREPLPVARHEVQALLDVLHQLEVIHRRPVEDHHAADVHVRCVLLLREK